VSAIELRQTSVRTEVAIPLQSNVTPDFITFNGLPHEAEHFALRFTGVQPGIPPLVRIHSECITGDLFRSLRCDCGAQLQEAITLLKRAGGFLLYLRQEGRGVGLYNKLDAYRLQEQGLDTYAANRRLSLPEDARDYACAANMLKALNVRRVRLLSNSPSKAEQLMRNGIEIVEIVPTGTFVNQHNREYLSAKVEIMGHGLSLARHDGR